MKKLNKNNYEFGNKDENLDFFFDRTDKTEIQVIVFDSLIEDFDSAYLGVFFADKFEDAVNEAKKITRNNVKDFVMWN
jgi:hypothetical protein